MLHFSDKRRSCRFAFFSILYSWQWPHEGLTSRLKKSSATTKMLRSLATHCGKHLLPVHCHGVLLQRATPAANIFGNFVSDSEGSDGSSIVRRIQSAIPLDQKVTLSRHMMAPKLRFSCGLTAKAPGAVTCTALVPAPTSRSSKFLQAQRPLTEHKKQRW